MPSSSCQRLPAPAVVMCPACAPGCRSEQDELHGVQAHSGAAGPAHGAPEAGPGRVTGRSRRGRHPAAGRAVDQPEGTDRHARGHIAQAQAAHADASVFTSLPRAGTVRAPTLLAEIGDARGRYPNEDALAAAAGVSPSTRAFGRARTVMFRRGCNRRLRQALVDFADGSRQSSAWAKAVYDSARARGARHAHAVRVLARAWIRVIWRCWTDRTPLRPRPARRRSTLT